MSRESLNAVVDKARVVYTGEETETELPPGDAKDKAGKRRPKQAKKPTGSPPRAARQGQGHDSKAKDGSRSAEKGVRKLKDAALSSEPFEPFAGAVLYTVDAGDASSDDLAGRVLAALDAPLDDDKSKSTEGGAEPPNASPPSPPPPTGDGFSVEKINRDHALVLMGSKAVIMKQTPGGPIADRQRVLTIDAFLAWFSNRFTEHRDADGKVKIVSWGQRWLKSPDRRQYAGIEFFPDADDAPGTPEYLNLWRGFAMTPKAKANGWHVFRDHLLSNVCGGDEAIFRWTFGFFAHLVQRPRERIGVALVLRGAMGCGKTIVGEHFGALFPAHYLLVDDPRYVTGQFNAHMASCLLLQADEAVWAGDKAAEGRLKGLVTSPTQQIEAKGVDPIPLKNYVRLVMTSNESWVVPAGKDERRFAVLDVDPRCVGNHQYFAEMAAELADGGYAALLADLLAFDLATVNLREIPKTAALLDQKERSLDSVPAWWLGRLVSGRSTRHADDWVRRVKREALFDDYIATSEKVGIKRRKEETIFGSEFRKLVPGLKTTRAEEATQDHEGTLKTVRVRYYELPDLKDCRSAWDESMHQVRRWKDETEVDAQGLRESEIHDGRDF